MKVRVKKDLDVFVLAFVRIEQKKKKMMMTKKKRKKKKRRTRRKKKGELTCLALPCLSPPFLLLHWMLLE